MKIKEERRNLAYLKKRNKKENHKMKGKKKECRE